MAGKISFPHGNDWGVIGPEGDYDLPVDSTLGHRFQLVDGEVVDRYDGVSDDEVREVDAERVVERQAEELQAARTALVRRVKTEAAQRIANLDWKVERARERDALNGTKTLQEVYAEREVIRLASNQAEAAIAKLASQEEILAFSW
ncbi:hypothetical protein [Magnetospirillum gryphiswaldense]|uniref:Uncharacterized protein n=1 Tax=Magnetospirillum gryphiswaldense TaxID=55518 RepID=A4TYN1_9PROT|nr:hypothetical protein [Magnetospirillum gryphiswaldense]AVM76193.1 hypothetical protein MSR1_37350 [Magnetospirillum gryphiswaldense MSR-1]AVM80096.1 hypothetical protein MSR1L_37350 [Magnetospirillum gryphiswaldense]CAM75738.1 conserved hypothetical protein [Magnetospirillum gryphiswaldense MSR-1]